jgi:hypothetical protein
MVGAAYTTRFSDALARTKHWRAQSGAHNTRTPVIFVERVSDTWSRARGSTGRYMLHRRLSLVGGHQPATIKSRSSEWCVSSDRPVTEWLLLVMALAAAGEPADPPSALPVSFDRIRAGLARTPVINLSAAVPPSDFQVETQGHPYYQEVPWTWEVAPGPGPVVIGRGSPALMQVDLLRLGRAAASAIGKANRARAAGAAREEPADALREFCADHRCEHVDP